MGSCLCRMYHMPCTDYCHHKKCINRKKRKRCGVDHAHVRTHAADERLVLRHELTQVLCVPPLSELVLEYAFPLVRTYSNARGLCVFLDATGRLFQCVPSTELYIRRLVTAADERAREGVMLDELYVTDAGVLARFSDGTVLGFMSASGAVPLCLSMIAENQMVVAHMALSKETFVLATQEGYVFDTHGKMNLAEKSLLAMKRHAGRRIISVGGHPHEDTFGAYIVFDDGDCVSILRRAAPQVFTNTKRVWTTRSGHYTVNAAGEVFRLQDGLNVLCVERPEDVLAVSATRDSLSLQMRDARVLTYTGRTAMYNPHIRDDARMEAILSSPDVFCLRYEDNGWDIWGAARCRSLIREIHRILGRGGVTQFLTSDGWTVAYLRDGRVVSWSVSVPYRAMATMNLPLLWSAQWIAYDSSACGMPGGGACVVESHVTYDRVQLISVRASSCAFVDKASGLLLQWGWDAHDFPLMRVELQLHMS